MTTSFCTFNRAVKSSVGPLGIPTQINVRPSALSRSMVAADPLAVLGAPFVGIDLRIQPVNRLAVITAEGDNDDVGVDQG